MTPAKIAALAPGSPLRRAGSVQVGRAGAWFYSERWNEPVLLTAAHVLGMPVDDRGDRTSAVLALDPGIVLCDGEGWRPAAAAVECGRHEPRYGITSADALLAVSLAPELIGAGRYTPETSVWLHDPRPCDLLTLAIAGEPARSGIVVEVGWNSDHYGAEDDVMIEGLGALPGDSGALLIDDSTGMPAAILVGEARSVEVDGRRYAHVACAHPLRTVLAMFGGFEWLLARSAR